MSKTIDELEIEDVIKLGINAGINYIKQQEELKIGKRKDRRLRNTKLLLKIYRTLKKHIDISDITLSSLKDEELTSILDTLDFDLNEENLIHSIVISSKRTALLVKHLDMTLDYLKHRAKSMHKPLIYNCIYELYINESENDAAPSYEEVCEKLHISQPTLSRYLNQAYEILAITNFGCDAIRL